MIKKIAFYINQPQPRGIKMKIHFTLLLHFPPKCLTNCRKFLYTFVKVFSLLCNNDSYSSTTRTIRLSVVWPLQKWLIILWILEYGRVWFSTNSTLKTLYNFFSDKSLLTMNTHPLVKTQSSQHSRTCCRTLIARANESVRLNTYR